MLVDQAILATLKVSAQKIWELKEKAEKDSKATREAKLAETLKEKWLKMNRKIQACELLLEEESELELQFEDQRGAAA